MALFYRFVIILCVENVTNNHQNYRPKTLAEAGQIISLLQENLQNQQEKIQTIEQQYFNLQQQIINLLHGKYGKSSEKLPEGFVQLSLLDRDKSLEHPIEESVQNEIITYTRKTRNGHRNIPDDMLRIRIEYKLEDLTCPCGCGNQLHKIGEVLTEQLEIVPAKI